MDAAVVLVTVRVSRANIKQSDLVEMMGDALTSIPAAGLSFRIDGGTCNGEKIESTKTMSLK